MKFLLDTDHISILQRQTSAECKTLEGHLAQHPAADIAFPIVSFHEQVLGAHAILNRAKTPADLVQGYERLHKLQAQYAAAQVVPFDSGAALLFGSLQSQKIRIGTMDLRIAAIALARSLTVLTRNRSDFGQVPGLQIEGWTK